MSLCSSGRLTPIIKRPSHVTHPGARQPYRRGPDLDRRCVPEIRTWFFQRFARPHAVRQNQPHAFNGRSGQTGQRPNPDERRRRYPTSGASAQRVDGLSAVHQLPDDDRVRKHRLAAASGRCVERDHPQQSAGNREDAAHREVSAALSAGAVRRSTATHRYGPRAGQGCRADPVR
ncbi:hypothetical protein D3C87_1292040 [compost metagenome]